MARSVVFQEIASRILANSKRRLCVAIDGVDGAGKTTFANDLAEVLKASDREIVRASADSFLNPREIRYAKGRGSPEGFYRDTYDYVAFRTLLLDPFRSEAAARYGTALFDPIRNEKVEVEWKECPFDAILIFDGMFLHRPELREIWDFSVFLDVDFEVSIPRAPSGEGYGSPDPAAESNRRYIEGQKLYFSEANPRLQATVVLNYNDLNSPTLEWRQSVR